MENRGHFCFQERLYLIDFGKSEHNAEAHSTELHECIHTCGFEGVTALILPPPYRGSSHSRAGGTCKDGYCVNARHPMSAGSLLCGSRGKQCTVIPLPKVITTQSETSPRFNTRELPELVKYSQLFAIEIKRTTPTSRLSWMTGFKKCSSRVESKEQKGRT